MDRNQTFSMSTMSQEDEEHLGLLDEGHQDKYLDFSDGEELDWEHDPKPDTTATPRRRRSWLAVLIVLLFLAWSIGLAVHYVIPGKQDKTSVALSTPSLRPLEDYVLSSSWDFDAKPTTREYHWTIEDHELNPDGVYRPMILINGMFPGPLVECNDGDEIVIHVVNKASNATSVHFHGLYQNGTNWMDGAVGITQCPIAPETEFTYRFRVDGQHGTYWYHSHMAVQASDGLVGPFIIHAKKEKELQQLAYQTDRVVMVSDHYYNLSSELLMHYLEPDRENAEPVPDAALINGRGLRNCDDLPNRSCNSSGLSLADFNMPEQSHRLRFINVGAFAEFQIQIDEHEFAVTEVDGVDVHPAYAHRLNINPAQRYSIVITSPDQNKGQYWLRARMVTHCFAEPNPELSEETRGIIKYWTPGPEDAALLPESKDWPEVIELECRDLNTTDLHPVEALAAPDKADDHVYLRSNFEIGNWQLSRGFLNRSSWRPDISSPALSRVIDGYQTKNETFVETLSSIAHGVNTAAFNPSRELVYQTTGIQTIDILIQNFDDGNHPFHLHGYKFWVLAQGHGYPPSTLYETIDYTNPLRRDTASVEAFGWTLIRFVADNPGIWSFHCHISWHAEAGLLMQFLTMADRVATWRLPDEVGELCSRPGIEMGKGPEDEIWFGHKHKTGEIQR